jgi:hypothetical protein
MKKVALADSLREWDMIIAQMDRHPELQTPQFRELRDALAATAEMTRLLADRQKSLAGLRVAVTRQLGITRGEGQDLVIKIQAALKSCFGHRWLGLKLFGASPISGRAESLSQVFGDGQLPVEDIRKGAAPSPDPGGAVQEAPPAAPEAEAAAHEED